MRTRATFRPHFGHLTPSPFRNFASAKIETVGMSTFIMKLRIRYLVEEQNLVYVACHVAGKFSPRLDEYVPEFGHIPISPASVVCGVGAVSARVAPVPHLVRYDWPFFRTAVDRASKRYLSRRA